MIIRIIIGLIVFLVLFHVVRALVLLRNANKLFAQSAQFSRDYFVGDRADHPLLYVAIGDSTAVGTGAQNKELGYVYAVAKALAAQKKYVHVINIAVSGAKIVDVTKDQLPQLSKLDPGAITLTAGANDATHFTSKSSFESDTVKLLTALKPYSAGVVLVASTPDFHKTPAFPRVISYMIGQRALTLNQIIKKQSEDAGFQYVDIYNDGKLDYTQYANDLFHPNDDSYATWSKLFVDQITK